MRVVLSLVTLALSVLLGPQSEAQELGLQGDPEAVAAIERMLERFGGREVWARGRTLYVSYDGWRTDPYEPVLERAWRDLVEPRQYAEYEGRSFLRIFALSPQGSWTDRDGEITRRDAGEHHAAVERYPYGFYTSLRSFAVADPRLRLEWQAPDRVIVRTEDGRERGWWQIDRTGAPIKWGAGAPPDAVEYVYGPMRAFGNISFPAWGAAVDGFWRWDYLEIDVSTEPLPDDVLSALQRPGRGALRR